MGIDSDTIINVFKEIVAAETQQPVKEIDEDATFHNLGLNSLTSVYIMEEMENRFNIQLNPMQFWDYPTIRLFSKFIQAKISSY